MFLHSRKGKARMKDEETEKEGMRGVEYGKGNAGTRKFEIQLIQFNEKMKNHSPSPVSSMYISPVIHDFGQ